MESRAYKLELGINTKALEKAEWVGKEISHLFNSIALSSRIVLISKLMLGAFALLLILILIFLPLTNSFDRKLKMTFRNLPMGEAKTPTMINPRFHGIDRNGRPYTVFADSAVQETQNDVKLININGEMIMNDGWVSLLSDNGKMDIEQKTIELQDSVNLFFDNGYEMITTTAHVDMAKSSAYGNDPVSVQGPLGTLHATGFTSDGRQNNIIFKGPVEVIIFPSGKNAAGAGIPQTGGKK